MTQPSQGALDPIGLLLKVFEAGLRAADPDPRQAQAPDAAQLLRQWIAAVSGPLGAAATASPRPELWARLLGSPDASGDLIGAWNRWYTSNSEALAATIDALLRAPEFVRASARALDDYASTVAKQRRAAELAARNLPFATHADVTRLAQLVIGLESKIEQALEVVDTSGSEAERRDQAGAVEALALADRLDRLEAKVDRLVAAFADHPSAPRTVRRRQATTAPNARQAEGASPAVATRRRRAAAETSQRQVRLVRGAKAR